MVGKSLTVTYEQAHAYLNASPEYFINKVYGYLIAKHHKNIIQHLNSTPITLDLAPRGCGKSRVGTIGYVSWIVCNEPNARVLILSDTDTHSIRFLNTIKAVLSTSPIIKEHYGDIIGAKWSDHQITTSLRNDPSITEASITALGAFSGGVTSGHYTHIFGDDIITFATSRTAGMRQRPKDWWATTVLPTLLPGAEAHILGTLYHHNDFYQYVQTQLGYNTQTQPAIIDIGTPKERSIWEDFMPLNTRSINGKMVKGLIQIRDGTSGTADSGIGSLIFGLQYMLDASLQLSGSIFKYDNFRYYSNLHREGGNLYVEIEEEH